MYIGTYREDINNVVTIDWPIQRRRVTETVEQVKQIITLVEKICRQCSSWREVSVLNVPSESWKVTLDSEMSKWAINLDVGNNTQVTSLYPNTIYDLVFMILLL